MKTSNRPVLTRRSGPRVMALEARLMFDAAAAADASKQVADEAHRQAQALASDVIQAASQSATAPETDATASRNDSDKPWLNMAVQLTGSESTARRELVVIAGDIANYQQIVQAVEHGPQRDVLVLDPSTDGLNQILAKVSGHAPYDAIHLVTHGESGQVNLGSTTLNTGNVALHQSALQMLGHAVTEQGDLLIYGCDVAEGAQGQSLLQQLSAITGTDVAASLDVTGTAAWQGDFELEAQTGSVETDTLALDAAGWDGRLVAPSVTLSWTYQLFRSGTASGFSANTTNPDIDPNTANASINGVNAATGSIIFTASAGSTAADGTFQLQGNDVTGTVAFSGSLTNASGTAVSGSFTLNGAISKHIKTIDGNSGDSEAFYFFSSGNADTSLNGLGFLLIVPADEGYFPATATALGLPADNSFVDGLNNFLTLQRSSPTVSVSNVTVSEASPYAVFAVTMSGTSTTTVSFTPTLEIAGSGGGFATLGTDTGTGLQYYNGSAWTNVTGALSLPIGSTSVLVRAAINNDSVSEGPETFRLSTGTITGAVSNVSGTYGTGTIVDDGSSGNVFLAGNTTSTPTTGTADNDTPGLIVTPVTGTTTEVGGTASFSVSLNTQPTQNVTVTVVTSDNTEGIPSLTTLTFTPSDWNTPQSVTVTGQDDILQDGDIAYQINLSASSSDTAYNGRSGTVNLTNLDNEAPLDVTPPVVTAGQTFSYAENRGTTDVLGTVGASDAVGVTGFRFGNGTTTSDDGFFSIDSSGAIRLTVAGTAAASNDFETAPNSFTHGVQARDAAGNWSTAVDVTLNVTDLDDTAPVVTAGQTFSYAENRGTTDVLGTVGASDAVGVTGFRFGNGTTTSDDGFFSIDSSGAIRLTVAGTAAASNDFETTPNSFTHGVQARDAAGNWSTAVDVTLNVTDLDDTAPVVTAGQTFSYAENRGTTDVLGTVGASDAVGVTGFRFGNGTTTSDDGFFSIDSSGAIRLTVAGTAAASNDFETTPNSFTQDVQARDAAGNWSAAVNITLNVTDLDDTAPVIGAGQAFDYAENRSSTEVLGTVAATDAVGVTDFRFNNGTTTSDDGFFSIDSAGAIRLTSAGVAAAANDFETTPNSFTHAVQARDAAGNWSAAVDVTLNVTDLDDTAPVVTAGQTFSYAENRDTTDVLATVAASDSVGVTGFRFGNGTAVSDDGFYTIDSSGAIRLTSAGIAAASNDFETSPNSFTHEVQARDAAGNWSASVNVTLNVTDGDDTAPVVSAGQAFTYTENQGISDVLGTVVATDANGVTDFRFNNGTTTSDDGFFSIDSAGAIRLTSAGVAAASNDFETTPNSFTHGVQARDAAGNWSAAVDVTLNVTDLDDTAPVIGAGQAFNYAENRSTTNVLGTVAAIDAVGVTDFRFNNGTTTSDDGFFSIDSAGAIRLTSAGIAAASNDFETTPNSFTHAVQARDAAGNWSAAVDITLNVTDLDDTAPVIGAGQAFNYAENRSTTDVLGTVAATDAIGVTDFRFNNGTTTSDDGFFSIDSAGAIRLTSAGVAAAANDFETTPNSFTHAIQARDAAGNWSAAVDITLNVTDLDDTAPVIGAGQAFNYSENRSSTEVLGTVAATDAVGVTDFRFNNGTTTSNDGFFSIDCNGAIRLTSAGIAVASNDFETTPNSFTHAVQARDAAGNWSAAVDVTLNVTDLDDTAPVIGAGQAFNYAENRNITEVLGTVAATDAVGVTDFRFNNGTTTSDDGYFSIDSNGSIRLTNAGIAAAANDFETTPNSFTHAIQARDAAGNWSAAVDITLNVTDLDDTAPVIGAGQAFNYAENRNITEVLGTVAATDAVGVTDFRFNNGTTTSDDGYFSIDSNGSIRLTNAGIAAAANDFETTPNSFTHAIQARDAAGNWSAAVDVTLNVTDLDDTAPLVTAGQTFSYAENRGTTDVLGTVGASDAVGVTGFRFGNGTTTSNDGFFSIDSNGAIRLTSAGIAAASNDFETTPNSFTHAIQARDAAGNWSAAVDITLNVTDLDDTAPVIGAGQAFDYAENRSSTEVLGTVAATDAVGVTDFRFNNGTTTSDDGFFSIDSNGAIRLTSAGIAAASNDFETTPNSFTHAVQARDAAGNWSAAVDVTLNVTDLDDTAPVIGAGQAFNYAENRNITEVLGTVAATDAVGVTDFRFNNGTTTSDDGYFSIDSNGAIRLTSAGVAAAANDFETTPNSFTHAIQARDAAGNWSAAVDITLNVTDLDDTAPVIGAGQTFNYAENRSSTEVLGTVAATDGAGVTDFRFNNGTTTSDDGYFSIDSNGSIRLTNAGIAAAANDFETTPNSFTHAIQARDATGNWSTAVGITLNVTDLDDTAPTLNPDQVFNYAENQGRLSTLGTIAASNATGVTDFRFSNGTTTSDDGYFSIDSAGTVRLTTEGRTAASNDYELAPNSFVHAVQGRDAAGNWSSAVDVTFNVTDLDDTAPVIDAGQAFSYAENRSATDVLGTVTASDATGVTDFRFSNGTTTSDDGYFSIDSNGAIRLTPAGQNAAANDFEIAPNSFTHAIQVSDAAGNWSAAVDVTLTLSDLDDTAPVIDAGQVFNYAENQGRSGVLGTIAASDAAGVTDFRFNNGTTTSDDGYFSVDSTGTLRLTSLGRSAAANDYETVPNTFVHGVQARDAAGNWSAPTAITLNVTDIDDTAPAITVGQSFNYAENQVAGAYLGKVAATDAVGVTGYQFANGTTTSDDGQFFITDDGAIHLTALGAESAANDFETGPNAFTLAVQARDAAGQWSAPVDVTLHVTDVDEAPPAPRLRITAEQALAYPENRRSGEVLGLILFEPAATGGEPGKDAGEEPPMDDPLLLSPTGFQFVNGSIDATGQAISPDGYFKINALGEISLTQAGLAASANDFERTPNAFDVQVQVRDGQGQWSAPVGVQLKLQNQNEPGTLAPNRAQISEDNQATGNVLANDSDPDDVLTVTSFRVGDQTVRAGETLRLRGIGSLTLDADGNYRFTPDANWHGTVPTITYLTSTGASSTLDITISPVNDPPESIAAKLTTEQDTPWSGRLIAPVDPDGDPVSFRLQTQAAHGSVTLNPDGSYRYTPKPGYSGTDRFEVQLDDGQGGTTRVWIDVQVDPVPVMALPPESDSGPSATDRVTTVPVINLTGTGTPGQTLRLFSPTGKPLGEAVVNAQGRWTVQHIDLSAMQGDDRTLPPGSAGAYTFTVQAVRDDGSLGRAVPLTVVREIPVVAKPVTPVIVAPIPEARTPMPAPAEPVPLPPPTATFDSALRSMGGPTVQTMALRDPAGGLRIETVAPAALNRNDGDIYTRPSGFQIMVNPAPEPMLKVFRGVEDQVVKLNSKINVQVPADTFIHTQINETVKLHASMADGMPLPRWLRFDGQSGVLEGEPPPGWNRDLAVRITARDSTGREATTMFRLKIGQDGRVTTGGLSQQLMRGEAWSQGQRGWQQTALHGAPRRG